MEGARSGGAEPRPGGDADRADLHAILAAPTEAVALTRACWAAGDAVAVLDPSAPEAETAARLALLRPTVVHDRDGARPAAGGRRVAADVAAVVVTSGTTADPRAVELTRGGMEAAARAVHAAIGREGHDRWLLALPPHHVAGLAIVARSFVCEVPLCVIDRFDPAAIGEHAGECTLTAFVPSMLARLLDEHVPVDRFRVVLLGGAPIPIDLLRRAADRGVDVRSTYGMTETWGGVVYDGRPLRGVTVDLDDDNEILVDAPMLMRGYHDDPAATAAAFTDDGWFRTGDIGAFLGDGRLRVVDRKKDVVITGGVNVSPTQVEAALGDHPGVADVCVAGVPDAAWGERVVAYVVPARPAHPPTLEELREHASHRLAAAELPRAVVCIDRIPRTENGKPMRRLLAGVE